MKISIKGAYGESNFGDDLLMIVFEDFIETEFDDVVLNFIGTPEQYVEKLLRNSTYNDDVGSAWLIYGGGTQFFSFKKSNNLFSKMKTAFRLSPSLFIRVLNNKILKFVLNRPSASPNLKTVFLGFGLGPFYGNHAVIKAAKEKMRQAEWVAVRDEVSYNYCVSWQLNAKLGADVVFSTYFQKYLNPVTTNCKGKIGIIVRDWNWEAEGNQYVNKIVQFVKNNPTFDFTFIIFAKERDIKWQKKIRNFKSLIWSPIEMEVTEFIDELNTFETIISARYHGAIIAGLLKKKVICVEIEDKLKILSQQIPTFGLWEKPFCQEELRKLLTTNLSFDHTYSINMLRSRADEMLNDFSIYFKNNLKVK